jgi:hypothetical protein
MGRETGQTARFAEEKRVENRQERRECARGDIQTNVRDYQVLAPDLAAVGLPYHKMLGPVLRELLGTPYMLW